jgi:hypothetical protein
LKLPNDCDFEELEFVGEKRKSKMRLIDIIDDLRSGQSKDYSYLLENNQKI